MGVIAIRPNAIFADPAMKPLARIANESSLLGMMLLPYMPFADLKLPFEEIEQIILFMHPITGTKNAPSLGALTVIIRAAHDFDWLKQMQQIDPQTKEERCGDRVYYRSHPKRGKGGIWSAIPPIPPKATFVYFIPDKRILVNVLPIEDLHAAQKSKFMPTINGSRPHFSWDKDWKHVERDLIAYAQVNRQAKGESKKQLGEAPFSEWPALTQKATTMTAGVDWKDGIALHAYLAYQEPAEAKRAIEDLKTFLKQTRRELMQDASAELSKDVPEPVRQAMAFQVELWKSLYDGVRSTRRGSTVCIHSKAKMTEAEIAKGLMYQFGGLFPTNPEMAPARK
jgi:hypothetical protein